MVRVKVNNPNGDGAYAHTKPLNPDPVTGEASDWGLAWHKNGEVIELRKPVRADAKDDPLRRFIKGKWERDVPPSEIDNHFEVVELTPEEALAEAKADEARAKAKVKEAADRVKAAEAKASKPDPKPDETKPDTKEPAGAPSSGGKAGGA